MVLVLIPKKYGYVLLYFVQQIPANLVGKQKLLHFVQQNVEKKVVLIHNPKINCTKYIRMRFVDES